jgi:predicted HTH domain antitoxin
LIFAEQSFALYQDLGAFIRQARLPLDDACLQLVASSEGSYPEPMRNSAPPAITYPSEILWALQQEPEEFEREARTFLALKLFEQGRLSSGLAAKLAGVPRLAFLFLLGQHGLSPVGVEPDELAEDLANARRAGSPE